VSDGGIDVTIEDDGPGFDAGDVRPHRLGILVSIHGRMSAVTGGSATVESSPGSGTVVSLRWAQS
jgi:signal transduction histidine kinase